ncbi:glycosyl hydrolase 115 family protein [Alteromonas gilva]|uniref:Glycosyl hydrolase 115 family protein n=1 Tax=Alteromonas gilva TaxID=2987522 RepID=A0ABT5L5G6_9ALTE|nr:glycosyl hydrolase 115 family protein [Alteromonas gilva]MDC8832305.1 glycosyl hydrolase 115 family protein [Alteromonas gilva]
MLKFLASAALLCASFIVSASGYVTHIGQPGDLTLADTNKRQTATIWVDAQANTGIKMAARSLQQDIARVTGLTPVLTSDISDLAGQVVIVGERGHSALVDRLIDADKLAVMAGSDKWEGYQLNHITNPLPGVEQAWVISGYDRRGVIFGIYDLSEKIGVSPWHWWADVPVQNHEKLFIRAGTALSDAPKVKYRGIFLNDEAPALTGMVHEQFGGYNAQFYQHVFELLLRLKANFLWPAMWNNAFADDDPQNMYLANDMGIVMSTSHHEPMMRADKEWNRYGKGAWEYSTNPEELYKFWVEGAKRYKDKEGIFTLGMRGQADTPMSEGENIGLLEKIVHDQREILSDVMDKPLSEVPQVWALYKEVQGFYERGMRVPDDVTLLWADDNAGNVRRLPTQTERERSGGAGVYYHFDYVGGPRSYRWINTVPLGKVWEQMNLSWEYGADQIWITNVGDLKPMELPISFFLAQAWDPERFDAQSPARFTHQWASQQFNGQYTNEITSLLNTYTLQNGRRKPESLSPDTFSVFNYHEAKRISLTLAEAADLAESVYQQIDSEYQDAFFQLVAHPVWATQAVFELNHSQALNALYAGQDRATTSAMAAKVNAWFERDAALTRQYHSIQDGKWNHMMSQPHIGYVHWNNPPANIPPVVHTKALAEPAVANMGVAVEGSAAYWPASDELALPTFTPFGEAERTLTVYNRQAKPFDWTATVSQPWVILSAEQGTVTGDTNVAVAIDWSQLKTGHHTATINVKGTGWGGANVRVLAHKPEITQRPAAGDFLEADGYVAINASNGVVTSNATGSWQKVALHGRTGAAMQAALPPYTSLKPAEAPALEFPVFFTSTGEFPVSLQLSPSLPFDSTTGIKVAVELDGRHVATLALPSQKDKQAWADGVMDNIKHLTTSIEVETSGRHSLSVKALTPGAVLQRIIIDTGGLKPSYMGPLERRK